MSLIQLNGKPALPAANAGLKALLIAILAMAMLVPIAMVDGVASERRHRAAEVRDELVELAGGQASVAGPVLRLPVSIARRDDKGAVSWYRETVVIMPETVTVDGSTDTSLRSRGIYAVPVYSGSIALRALFRFDKAAILALLDEDERDVRMDPANAALSVELRDLRCLRDTPTVTVTGAAAGSEPLRMKSGEAALGVYGRAVSTPLPLVAGGTEVLIDLPLGGGGSLSFVPLGGTTKVSLESDWASPSFSGYVLPAEREVRADGFTASWYLPESLRAVPGMAYGSGIKAAADAAEDTAFGVELYTPVDVYQKTTRALKYSLLFVVVPFAALFLFEIFLKTKIHPIQYVLVGFANAVFYLVVLSVSEHAPFAAAYWGAATVTALLVSWYGGAAVKSAKRGFILLPVLGAAYAYLYAALESEDYALVIGSVGLMAILAAVMLATRKVDWYRAGQKPAAE